MRNFFGLTVGSFLLPVELICLHGHSSGTPNPYNLSEKYWQYTSNLYRSTPPICNAVPRWLPSLEDRETRSTPPICTAIRLPFVPQYTSHLYRRYFEKIPGVGGSRKFLITVVFGSFLTYSWSFLLANGTFMLTIFSLQ